MPAFYTQNSADMPNRWRLHFAGRHLLLAALPISAAAIMAGKLRYLVNIEKWRLKHTYFVKIYIINLVLCGTILVLYL